MRPMIQIVAEMTICRRSLIDVYKCVMRKFKFLKFINILPNVCLTYILKMSDVLSLPGPFIGAMNSRNRTNFGFIFSHFNCSFSFLLTFFLYNYNKNCP